MIPITEMITYGTAFIILGAGSYTDLKTREVPDWINYGLISIGLFLGLLFSVFFNDYSFIIRSILGLGISFALAWAMFYSGQWGGGDSKMLMGLGAVLGMTIKDFMDNFMVSFFINMLFVGAAYGLIFSIYLALRKKKKFIAEYKKISKEKRIDKIRKYLLILMVLVTILFIFVNDHMFRFLSGSLLIVIVLSFYLWVFVKVVEKACMYKYVNPSSLTEGDWIAKDVKIGGKVITGPKDLGIEKKKIRRLINLYNKGKVKKILIKEGIPFVPSFFLSFIVTYFFGNLMFLFF